MTTRDSAGGDGLRRPEGARAGRLAIVVVGVLFALVAGACSDDKQANRESHQNATLWGGAICSIVEATDSTAQEQALGQAKHYSDLAVQMIAEMKDGAAQIDSMVDALDADKTANSVTKFVPDLKAIEQQAATLSGQSEGDESDAWDSLSGSVATCVAQLPPNLQGN